MKIRLLNDIDFEYHGQKKTRLLEGSVHVVTASSYTWIVNPKDLKGSKIPSDILDGYWIGTQPFQVKCFLRECEIVESEHEHAVKDSGVQRETEDRHS